MKKAIFSALVSFIFVGLGLADEKDKEIDFLKAFPKEKVFSMTRMDELGIETYGYLTNTEMKEWEEKLLKFLGKGWKKKDVGEDIKGHLKLDEPDVKELAIEVVKIVEFSRVDDVNFTVMLSQSKAKIGETNLMITLMVMRDKKQEEPKEPKGGVKPSEKKE